MCEFKSVPQCFGTLSSLLYTAAFILTLINMIFSCINPKEFNTFNYIQLIDYNEPLDYSFLMELKFDSDFIDSADYGSIGSIKDICYLGKCVTNFTKKSTYNCSLACLNQIDKCYDGENLCDAKECEDYSGSSGYKVCHEFNRIKIWRNTKMKKLNRNFRLTRYSHIIPNNGSCLTGYKKCGIINDAEDYLCLKDENDCPINSIIIKSENVKNDSDYESYQFGDKFIFFSNKKINNKIITNITISTSEIDKKKTNYENIDMDYYSTVLKYNPYIYYSGWSKPSIVYLNLEKFETNFTYKDMIKFQEKYETRSKIYTKDTINEMNTKVHKYKSALMGFGIAVFSYLAFAGFFFIPLFSGNDCKCHSCCIPCREMTSMKRVLIFYTVFSPCIILSFISLPFTIIKTFDYNELKKKEYISEYKNFGTEREKEDFFEDSILYNHNQFILLLIIDIIIIVYPILIKITTCFPFLNTINNSENVTYNNNRQRNKNINTRLVRNNQVNKKLLSGQYNSNQNFNYNNYYQKPSDDKNSINYPTTPTNSTPDNYQYPSKTSY